MLTYVVRQGDYLDLIAWRHGVPPAAIWENPANRALRQRRGDGNVLQPGDVVFVPEARVERLPVTKGRANGFLARSPSTKVRIRLHDEAGAIAGEAFTVEGPLQPVDGTTDGDGVAEFELPMSIGSVILRVPSRSKAFRVDVGHLDPISSDSGVRSRLHHLGLLRPSSDPDRDLEAALSAFQQTEGLEVSGEADEATRRQLEERHGS